MYFLYSLGGVTFNKCWITLSILNCYSPNFQGFILMKNLLNNQVGMLGDMFLWLVANLKQGVIYFIKQGDGNHKIAWVYELFFWWNLRPDKIRPTFTYVPCCAVQPRRKTQFSPSYFDPPGPKWLLLALLSFSLIQTNWDFKQNGGLYRFILTLKHELVGMGVSCGKTSVKVAIS